MLLAGTALVALAAVAAPALPSTAALRIVSDRVLSKDLEKARDVRWASDQKVYLSLSQGGMVEASLDPGGPAPREMIPGNKTVGGWRFGSWIGASPSYLVMAGHFGLTWRTLDQPLRQEARLEKVEDIDVAGDQLLALGIQVDESRGVAPDGTIVWLGSLAKGLSDLRPILSDARGPGALNHTSCGHFEVGGVRFLAGGSFIVVPGVQPGAYLYDSKARLVRTWDTAGLGIDTDCASLGDKEIERLATDIGAREAWLNRRRTLDEILPLPQGPGLVIRSVIEGRTRWQIKVLREAGGVATIDIPADPVNVRSHLRGDVRGGRIVFVMYTYRESRSMPPPASRLIVAEVLERGAR
ncbi:MAG TPA: hypothetical protein VHQ90_25040 [Thermoanaerobaculia bacterium]|nr:hypothetical protein [Thermoanaerobaculia bacterium]